MYTHEKEKALCDNFCCCCCLVAALKYCHCHLTQQEIDKPKNTIAFQFEFSCAMNFKNIK